MLHMKELLYQKIAENLRSDIRNGKHEPGERLPGVRELSAEWKTSPNTILKALSFLEHEGYLRKTQGQGIFVNPSELWSDSIEAEIELLVYDMAAPFNMMLVGSIEKAARGYGCRLTVKTFDEEDIFSADSKAAGRIIIPSKAPSIFVKGFASAVPVICIGEFNPPEAFNCSYAVADTYAGFYKAVQFMLHEGRERIAYIGASVELEDEAGWNACRDALSGGMNGFRREYAVSAGGWDAEHGQAAMKNILLGDEYPDGLICCNDSLAAGAYKACRAAGLSIPEDISIIGAGDQDIAPLLEPPLTSLKFPSAVIGLTAVNFIDSIITGKISKDEVMRCRLDMEFVIRGSLAAAEDVSSGGLKADGADWL